MYARISLILAAVLLAAAPHPKPHPRAAAPSARDTSVVTHHSIHVDGTTIAYTATAGTLVLNDTKGNPEASVFYVAYTKDGADRSHRPVTFLYNGGPGCASSPLHMLAVGPRRVVVGNTEANTPAPAEIVDNQDTLLDKSDVVFIDAPGTGLSRTFGKEKAKAFYGIDADAHAFARFIHRFLSKYDRWNSPKYLFGESYGTPRSAVLAADLRDVDLNGIVLLSQILSFDNSIDDPRWNPGVDQAYALALPTYAATAYYFHKLPNQPAALKPFLAEVEKYALGDYMTALLKGSELSDDDKRAVAEKLRSYTGLPVDYLIRSDLRVVGGDFSKALKLDEATTIGRLDTRFQGPDINPLSEGADYDPQSDAISSAWTAAINDYLHRDLKYGQESTYWSFGGAGGDFTWDLRHHAPDGPPANDVETGANVMPDLAFRMKLNPKMKIMLAGGYYDLATPYFEGVYEMHHLQIPKALQSNISYHYYEAGHMIYVNEDILKQFRADVAGFIKSTEDGR